MVHVTVKGQPITHLMCCDKLRGENIISGHFVNMPMAFEKSPQCLGWLKGGWDELLVNSVPRGKF